MIDERHDALALERTPATPGPLVVIIPSIFGVTPDVVQYADLFSSHGALVYAMDPFWQDGAGALRIPEEGKRAMGRLTQVSDEAVLHDVLSLCEAGLAHDKCNGRVIVLGVCFGGRFALMASRSLTLDGIAIWHGADLLDELDPDVLKQTGLTMDFGTDDPLIPMADIDALKSKLRGLTVTLRLHENCGHGFTHWGTERCVSTAAEAAAQGVQDLIRGLLDDENSGGDAA